jgi:hypothetical protein
LTAGEKIQAGDDPGSFAGALLFLLAGPLAWAGHLGLVYGTQSVLCAFRITGVARVDTLLIEAMIGVVTALAAVMLMLAMWLPRNTARRLRAARFLNGENGAFMISVMRLLAALSLAGVLWAGATVLLLDPCPPLR